MLWDYAFLGFDTQKRLWFIDYFGPRNENMGVQFGKNIIIKNGHGFQYQWSDEDRTGKFWHIREVILAQHVKQIYIDDNDNIIIEFKELNSNDKVPDKFSFIRYAYHLGNGLGFVEFYDESNNKIHVINNKFIIVENLNHKTVGVYPKIRFHADRNDIDQVIVTNFVCIIKGRNDHRNSTNV